MASGRVFLGFGFAAVTDHCMLCNAKKEGFCSSYWCINSSTLFTLVLHNWSVFICECLYWLGAGRHAEAFWTG